MRLIKHTIFVELGDCKKLMINSLNGAIDKIDDDTFKIISRWKGCEEIIPNCEAEVALFDNLKSRGYLVQSYNEELEKKNKILQALRGRHDKSKINNGNIMFIMTYDCNFRCSYCFESTEISEDVASCGQNSSKARDKISVMTPKLIDAAFELAGSDLKSVGLFGGEPLLPKTRSAIEYIASKAHNKSFNIITNGYYLEEFIDILSGLTISQIMVTLDGMEETHNLRRYLGNGKPTYNKIMAGIKLCLKNNIAICIRMNLDKSNCDEAKILKSQLIDEFSDYKDLLSFELSPMIGASYDERNQMFAGFYSEEGKFPAEEMQRNNRMLGKFTPIVNAITAGANPRPVYSFCYAHDNGLLVDPLGNIFPCLLAVGIDDLAIGKYYPEIDFYEKSIRHRNIETIPECRDCVYSLLCGGGCPVAFSDYKNLFRPECFSIKNDIHNNLPAFFLEKEKSR